MCKIRNGRLSFDKLKEFIINNGLKTTRDTETIKILKNVSLKINEILSNTESLQEYSEKNSVIFGQLATDVNTILQSLDK